MNIFFNSRDKFKINNIKNLRAYYMLLNKKNTCHFIDRIKESSYISLDKNSTPLIYKNYKRSHSKLCHHSDVLALSTIRRKAWLSLPQPASAYPWSHEQKQQLTLENQS